MSSNLNSMEERLSKIGLGSNEPPPPPNLNNATRDMIKAMINAENYEEVKQLVKQVGHELRNEINIKLFFKYFIDVVKTDLQIWEKIERMKIIINDIEEEINNELSNLKLDRNEIAKMYSNNMECGFDEYFKDIIMFLSKYVNCEFNDASYNIISCLMNVPYLLDAKFSDPLLYALAKFIAELFRQFNHVYQFQLLIIQLVMQINHRLINYLAVPPGVAFCRGLSEAKYIYSTVRSNLVNVTYNSPEVISKALTILEQRSRFFGMTADAIPENVNQGDFIVVDTMNAPLEDDDVYEEYEKFLADLPK